MKKLFYSLILSICLFSCTNKHEKSDTLMVYGNCGMCKQTIEKSLSVEGVYTADWNKKTKILSVSYDSLIISKSTIATHVANAGYDNELVKAKDDVYDKLHSCCQYKRAEY